MYYKNELSVTTSYHSLLKTVQSELKTQSSTSKSEKGSLSLQSSCEARAMLLELEIANTVAISSTHFM